MKYAPTATYKAICRKSVWKNNRVTMPKCSFASPAIYSFVLALSNRVVNVQEALYYYRRFRENSIIELYAVTDNTLALEGMDFLMGEFKRTGLYERMRVF